MSLHLQEYIEGRGYGFFSLFQDGEPVLCQMHERIWEYPVTGGPSVYARTVCDRRLEELGLRLLRALRWNGVAMVEFRKAAVDGDYRLMEINPRFWGSLDLSIAAGADCPYLAVCRDRDSVAPQMAVRSTRYLWVVPDGVLYLTARPGHAFRFLRLLLSPLVHKNVWLRDPRPLIHQVRDALYWTKTLLLAGRLRFPQDRPMLPSCARAAARH